MKLSDLEIGQTAVIIKIDKSLLDNLGPLGVREGKKIFLKRRAPLGDPLEIWVDSNSYGLRKGDANLIDVEQESK